MKDSAARSGSRLAFAGTLLVLTFGLRLTAAWAVPSNPTPQALPYSQNFSGLAHSDVVYPAGWQGWHMNASPGAAFSTAAPFDNQALTANGGASSSSGAVYNYNGKIGYLDIGGNHFNLAVALNTTDQTNIALSYDVATIRNPYNGGTETRINEIILQYRVGTSGTFTNVAGTEYQNNTTTQTGAGVTTPLNPQTKSITLPAACNNQPVVQLRWISRQVSGSGARPSFSIDNFSASGTGPFTLTLNAINGSIAPVPNQATYLTNTLVSLTANPALGYHFVNWSGDASGVVNPTSVTMDANKSVTANFAINTYTINATAGPNGSISPPGATVYNYGDDPTYTITPAAGYSIADVLVDAVSVGAVSSHTFTDVAANHTIHATFAPAATVNAVSPGAKITLGNPNVTVPVTITRTSGTPMVLGFSVAFQASSPLMLPAGRFSITLPPGGGFLNADGGRNVLLQTVDLGGGSYQADGVILGAPCGSSALTGTLFNIAVSSAALAGTGTIEITSVALRECSNLAIPVASGPIASVTVNRSAPAVTVVAPNGGEIYPVASVRSIQWTATDPEGVSSVDLAYSTDGGATYPNVIATGLANSGSYAWTVPNTVTSLARVRATATDPDANQGEDASDADFTIGCPTITVSANTTHVLCNGDATGAIDISVSGGTGPYTYLWSDGPTSEDRSGLIAASYTVVVTDVYGCTGSLNVDVLEPPALLVSETHTDPACFGEATGTIDVTVSGGVAPYSYLWGDGPTTQDRSGLVAGLYSLTVTDANGCTELLNVTIAQPAQLIATESHVNVACFGDATGSIDVSVAGGTAPYTYLWADGPTTEDRSGLVAGPYSLTVTDANGCTAVVNVTIAQPLAPLAAIESHVDVACFGDATGSIDVTVTGGTSPYTYLWNDGATTQDRTGLLAGVYSVTVTDANGCTTVTGATIAQPLAPLAATETHLNLACFGDATGSIDVSVTGGTAPYTYLWNDGATTQDRTGLVAGIYSVTVTDANGCTTVTGATITSPPQLVATESHVDVLCFGDATGSIDVSVAGGTATYTYLWADGPTTEDRSGLVAGPYSLMVTDANGCTAVVNVTIAEPALLVANETHTPSCLGTPDGTIDVTVTGGTAPYTYLWGDGPTSEDRSGLAAGSYALTVTDANGCTAGVNVTIVLRSYTITASAGSNGAIVPNGAVVVTCGADQAFTITADPGYHVDDVVVDAVSQGPQSGWTFTNVQTNHTIHVTFAINPPVAPVANLTAVQQTAGNPAGSITRIQLSWDATPPGVTVEVWRKGFGHYPRYDDDGGAEPTPSPTYPPGAGWELTGVTTSGGMDLPATRDFMYYVAYAQDVYGTRSVASNRTDGTLDYHLGDVSDGFTAGVGNNLVATEDISLLGSHYGVIGAPLLPYSDLDVGPTTTGFIDGRPTTDQRTNFEDLVIFALNYGLVSRPVVRPAEGGFARDEVAMDAPASVAMGEAVSARITMQGTGSLRALSAKLEWDPAVVTPVRQAAGDWLARLGGVAFSPEAGTVDAAVFSSEGLIGEGTLATVEFRVLAAGDPKIRIASLDARDARNQKGDVSIAIPDPIVIVPSTTQLAPARPNPFLDATTIAFSLATPGSVDLAVYGVDGKLLRTLVHEAREAGEYSVAWDGREDSGTRVAPGVYYVRLVTAQGRFVRAATRLR